LFSLESHSKDITWLIAHDKHWLIRQRDNTNEIETLVSSLLHYETCRLEPDDVLLCFLFIQLNTIRGCIWQRWKRWVGIKAHFYTLGSNNFLLYRSQGCTDTP